MHAATDRRRDARGGVHVGARAAGRSGSGAGKTVGVDATTLEENAAMRSIERRDTLAPLDAALTVSFLPRIYGLIVAGR